MEEPPQPSKNPHSSDVSRLLDAIDGGDPKAAEELLPLVYEELRRLAAYQMAQQAPGQTLQPTALVHEAWLKLVGGCDRRWETQRHFFAAAAEAMRHILIDRARRKRRLRHGGGLERIELEELEIAAPTDDETVLAVNEALDELQKVNPVKAEIAKLKIFVGLSNREVAAALGIPIRTVERYWAHARAWLFERIEP